MALLLGHVRNGVYQVAEGNARAPLPEKRTSADSGMVNGITPKAAAKATSPDPAGNEIERKTGVRVAARADLVRENDVVEPAVNDAVTRP